MQTINFLLSFQKKYFFRHSICAEAVMTEKRDKLTGESSPVYPGFLFMDICQVRFQVHLPANKNIFLIILVLLKKR